MWIIAGLGNPGHEYENTRHNLGFIVLEEIAGRLGSGFKKSDNYMKSAGFIGDEKIILIKPLTFMNLSGRAVSHVLSYYRCGIDRLVVIHDDLDIEAGRMKIKIGGGSGGHKGIESIISALGSGDFVRIKIGIGKPAYGNAERYVLGKINREDAKLIHPCVIKSADAVEMIINHGYEKAMNAFNSE
ncbi:peptidyl-tRNA hydrolase [bacterium BMS3Abin07]|nr:peptidyl-tRNA hydrolase [bacterium BMS3Abin07]GBE32096.1 peptidyl-tRNA hydrolase [bacterium BMS3Bbin05]HDO22837.1 aminoacyl-tRNA hydrolase [Nitrospirota bacterium]HDZ88108.1 aminoacyl-tRNA hydrolase [Nitrospirota bacterium]